MALGVERCVSISLRGVFYDFLSGNEETLTASEGVPFILPAATLDPRKFYGRLDPGIDLTRFSVLRVFPDAQGWPFDFAPFYKLLETASCNGLPVMAPAMGHGCTTVLLRAASKHGLPVIVTSVNYSTLSEVLALLPEHEDLSVCIDMLNTPDGIELICDEFGPERLVFGSNYPTTYFQGPLLAVQRAQISEGAKSKILGENAKKLMGIK
jgi:predicted TIM-barrel fold metal-dependent hydrolase